MVKLKGRTYLITIYGIIGIICSFSPILIIPSCLLLLFIYRKGQLLFILLTISFSFFFIYTSIIETNNESKISEDTNVLQGKIKTIPVIEGDRLSFEWETVRGESVAVFYRMNSAEQKQELRSLLYGMNCILEGELQEPSGRRNFYDFNYRQFLHYKKINWVFKPKNISLKQCNEGGFNPIGSLYRFKQKQMGKITDKYPESIAGMVIALVFGDKNEVSDQVIKIYQQQGLIHLLAISGLHVGLVVGLIFYILIRIGITRERASTLLVMLIIPIYILLTGATPSIIRAGFMSILILLSYRFKLRINPLDIISIVCLTQIILNPYIVFNLGFQFSYLISFTLIVSSKKLLQAIHTPLKLTVIITSISQLISLPLVLWTNYEISIFSILLNMIFIPFISLIILPLSLLSVLLLNINDVLSTPVIQVIKVLLEIAHGLLFYISKLGYGNIVFGKPNILMLFMLYGVVFYLLLRWEKKQSILRPMVMLVGTLLLIFVTPYTNPNAKVTFIDIGQGDSILVELPHRKGVYLIDTGGQLYQELRDWQKGRPSFEPGEDVVLPYLKASGIRSLSGLVLTHGDMDHVGGSYAVVKEMKINAILAPKTDKIKTLVNELMVEVHGTKPDVHYLSKGDSWEVGGQHFFVVNPESGTPSISENDQSVVLLVTLQGVPFLFTGDLESTGEASLIKAYPNLNAAILKVGHHGSATSTSMPLLKTIMPQIAVISVGEHNRFGHPNKAVLDRLKEMNINTFRTDQLGAIKFVINKEGTMRIFSAAE